MRTTNLYMAICISLFFSGINAQEASDYLHVIKSEGTEPYNYIYNKLQTHDLVIFDDALHSAVEPFDFYTTYLEKNPGSVDYVFLEVVPITAQEYIDTFMASPVKDTMLLASVFQQDFNYGWPYETYLTFLMKVWDINNKPGMEHKIKIIGVDQPIYWEGLHSREDYNIFQESLIARDNFMYRTILKYMKGLNGSSKGIFLTNTRHAYKGIKARSGQFYWNTGTFFSQLHPGKTFSVRFHNMTLFIEAAKENIKNSSTEGLDRYSYKWVRMDNGHWDEAFASNGNKPVAIPLKDNIFGQCPYIGNHMMNIEEGMTMYDAYDAIIFMKSLEETRISGITRFYFTDEFKKELQHRVRIIQGDNLDEYLDNLGFKTIDEFIEDMGKSSPESPNPLVN